MRTEEGVHHVIINKVVISFKGYAQYTDLQHEPHPNRHSRIANITMWFELSPSGVHRHLRKNNLRFLIVWMISIVGRL